MFKKSKTLLLTGVLTLAMSTTALGALLPTDRTYGGDAVVEQSDGSTIEYYKTYYGKVTTGPVVTRTVIPGTNGDTVRYDANLVDTENYTIFKTGAYLTVSNVLRESVTNKQRLLYANGPVTLTFSGDYLDCRTIMEFNNYKVEEGKLLYNKSLNLRTMEEYSKTTMNDISSADQTKVISKPGMYLVKLQTGLGQGVHTYIYVAGPGEDVSYVAPTTETATATSVTVNVDGQAKTAYGYSINGKDYFRLRDMAALVNGTGKQFDISEAPGMNMVTIKTYNSPVYTAIGGELTTTTSGTQTATPTTKNYAIDSSEVRPSVYNIDGAEYVNLIDLAQIVDFNTTKDSSTNTISIDTTTSYSGVGAVVAPVPVPIKVASTERLAGQNRFQTAVAISQNGWAHSDNVVLANGNDFHDALVGSSFAYLKDAPMLITPSGALDADTGGEIARLGAKTVYILGNTKSVSQAVEDSLKQSYTVVRIGGADVFGTAVQIGNEVRKTKQFDTVALATFENFPDALAISPYSAKNTMPILFSGKNGLGVDTQDAIQAWGVKNVIIAGGTGVISSAIETQLTGMGIKVTRLFGQDRYDTALEIVKHFAPQGGYTNISIATGENYPDALTGAVLAAKLNMPMVLVEKNSAKSTITDYLNSGTLDKAYIFGGTAVVSTKITGK